MKNTIRLKTLVTLPFLLFIMPFLKTCSDKKMAFNKKNEIENVAVECVVHDKSKAPTDTLRMGNNTISHQVHPHTSDEFTVSYYGLLQQSFGPSNWNDLGTSTFKDLTFYPLFGFLVVFLLSILNGVLTFLGNYAATYRLGMVNLLVLILATFGLVYVELLEELAQLKIGYYALFLNFVGIVIVARFECRKE
ncbi:MAG: hypothetical protein RL607_423 [Bacteroidota bacterium]|jgi:hypothetical protein